MDGIFYKIDQQKDNLSNSFKQIANLILEDPDKIIWSTIEEFAKACDVSNATITRFCQHFGFGGFKELKTKLTQEFSIQNSTTAFEPESKEFKEDIMGNLLKRNIAALMDTEKILSKEKVLKAAKLINDSQKIMCAGIGASDLVAQDLMHKLLRIQKTAFVYNDNDLRKVALSQFKESDLLIAISYSGKKREILELVKQAKEQNVPIISITRVGKTEVGILSTVNIEVAAFENDFRSSALSSRIVQLYAADVLFYTFQLNFQDEPMIKLRNTYDIIRK